MTAASETSAQLRANLDRYSGWGGERSEDAVIALPEENGVGALGELAEHVPPGGVVALLGTPGSGHPARRSVRRLTPLARRAGFEPLGWHPDEARGAFCVYARKVSPEPALPESERGRPPHPPRIPADPVDVETAVTDDLYALGRSTRLCDWMFAQYAQHVRGSVAEVGAGIGTFSERILLDGAERLLLIEPAESCLPTLEQRFGGDTRVRIVSELLPGAPSLREGGFDLIVCQNVLEHIADDAAALQAMSGALSPSGYLALLVPAHPRLFGPLDDAYGHYRRYSKARIRSLFDLAGLQMEVLRPFNTLGILGWWLKNRRPGMHLDERSLRTYELLVRFWRPAEERIRPPWGLSLIAQGRPR
jgi:SAM-dependent methyltransferase